MFVSVSSRERVSLVCVDLEIKYEFEGQLQSLRPRNSSLSKGPDALA